MAIRCERSFEKLDDVQVPNLETAEQFVLGAARCWDAFNEGPDPTQACRELYPVFVYMNMLGALCAFDNVFRVLKRHRLAALEFFEVDSTLVASSEARLLCGLACLQHGDVRGASDALTGTLTRSGVHAVLPPLARIAALLAAAGHHLPQWARSRREAQRA